jgi:hypothetical protein
VGPVREPMPELAAGLAQQPPRHDQDHALGRAGTLGTERLSRREARPLLREPLVLASRRAATSVATSKSSDASTSSTRPYDLDAAGRSGRTYALPRQVEGLVRDNRVEVRVLFRASREGPASRGLLSFRGHVDAPRGNFRGNALRQMENHGSPHVDVSGMRLVSANSAASRRRTGRRP